MKAPPDVTAPRPTGNRQGRGADTKTEGGESIAHDLTPDELAFLIEHTPRGRSAWKWIRLEGGCKLVGPTTEHDGARITKAAAVNDVAPAVIVRAIHDACRRRHERRSRSAQKAAVTKAKRNAAATYRAAEAWVRQALTPRTNCRCCGRGLTDAPSIAVGIGSECRERVNAVAAVIARVIAANHDLPTIEGAVVRFVRDALGEEQPS
jgi:hypothetical protein